MAESESGGGAVAGDAACECMCVRIAAASPLWPAAALSHCCGHGSGVAACKCIVVAAARCGCPASRPPWAARQRIALRRRLHCEPQQLKRRRHAARAIQAFEGYASEGLATLGEAPRRRRLRPPHGGRGPTRSLDAGGIGGLKLRRRGTLHQVVASGEPS